MDAEQAVTTPSARVDGVSASARPAVSIISASNWYETFPAPTLASSVNGHARALIHRFTGIAPEIVQPALKDNVICIHLGGPKRVHRWHEGRRSVHEVELGSLTLMPARQENRWLTEGPVDFAHLTLSSGFLHQIAMEEFDAEPAGCELIDRIGARDPLIEPLFQTLVRELAGRGFDGRLYPESLLTVLAVALLKEHSALSMSQGAKAGRSQRGFCKGGLAGWQLRRVVDHMVEFMATDIALGDLTAMTGLSRAQFFRAFKRSTGLTPHRFLIRMRIDRARLLLERADLSVCDVGHATGFAKLSGFAAAFKQQVGVHPRLYKQSRA